MSIKDFYTDRKIQRETLTPSQTERELLLDIKYGESKRFIQNDIDMDIQRPVVFFDLFDTLVKVDRGILEPYFDRETDRLGDLGVLKNSKETIEVLRGKNPTMDKALGMTPEQMAEYYDKVMKTSLKNPPQQVLDMLAGLKNEGYKLCVISDAAYVDIAGWSESPLSQYFDNTVFSCEVGFIKPDPQLFYYAKSEMGNPMTSIFVGDGGHEELMGAQQTGMHTIKAEWINNRRVEEIYRYAQFKVQEATTVVDVVKGIEKNQFKNIDISFKDNIDEFINSFSDNHQENLPKENENLKEAIGDDGKNTNDIEF